MHTSFLPRQKALHGPGPSTVHPRILEAMSRPTIGHLDPDFVRFMEEIKLLLQTILFTDNRLTFPISGPGSVGMEACFVNLIEPHDRILVCVNGVFGTRMVDIVKRIGAIPLVLEMPWGQAIDPAQLEQFLEQESKKGPIKAVAFVHAETSTGALSDAETLCALIQKHNALIIMDAVTSVAGVPVYMDKWGIDALYTGTQKCLSAPPGLSPVSFSEKALQTIESRSTPIQSWFMDLSLIQKYWNQSGQTARTYHHTAPVNLLYGLHEALVLVEEEGIEQVWRRHQETSAVLKEGLLNLGYTYFVPESAQMPQLHVVKPPEHISNREAEMRSILLKDKLIEVGGGLGPLAGTVWRIGLMGNSAGKEQVETLLDGLKSLNS